MGMSRAQKQAEIEELKERFSREKIVVITHYSGLSVSDMTDLRAQLREEGASFKVTKNSLAKIAVKGTDFEELADLFTGPTGVATSEDPVAAAKVAHKYAKENDKLIIVGGALGTKILSVEEVEQLAKLPSKDEIRSKFVGLLQAPLSKLVGVLQAPARDMVGVTKAFAEKGE